MALITGNTYPVKEQIKALGGKWNKPRNGWDVPDENADQARALVESAGPARERTYDRSRSASHNRRRRGYSSRYVSNVTRFSSGAVVYTNKGGRCEDAPCCGCCS